MAHKKTKGLRKNNTPDTNSNAVPFVPFHILPRSKSMTSWRMSSNERVGW